MGETASGSRAGSRVGRYLLNRLLGHGPTGEVYDAVDIQKNRTAALKLVAPALGSDPAFREWLQREALTVGRVQEPHVVPVRDYGELDGEVFIDMPLVSGADLSAILKRTGVLPPYRAVNVVWQAAAALDAAHAAGVIHRGIKPRNILLTSDDFVYLVDFGIAGAPGASSVDAEHGGARWKYSAPELFGGGDFGRAVDVYSLACVLYQCLTGAPPYRADSVKMLAKAHQSKPIPRPSLAGSTIPPSFDAVIAKGMAKDPAERYSTTAELATAAYQALSAPDQHRTVQIYEASQQATPPLIEPPAAVAPATPAAPPVETPQPPAVSQPAPTAPTTPSPAPSLAPASPATPSAAPRGPETAAPEPVASVTNPDLPRVSRVSATEDDWFSSAKSMPAYRDPAKRARLIRLAAISAVVIGLVTWLVHRSGSDDFAVDSDDSTASQSAVTVANAEAEARLLKLLPAGYPQGACKATAPSDGAIAEMTCGRNVDLGGPASATYSLFDDADAMHQSFDNTTHSSTVVECPNKILSPGAWHAANSQDKAGMLLCGNRQGAPLLAWSNEKHLVIGAVHSEHNTPTLDQLYSWWSLHS